MEKLIKCPRCDKSKSPKLYINTDKKAFICFRCHDFKGVLGKLLVEYPAIAEELETDIALEATIRYKKYVAKPKHIDILEELNPVVSIEEDDDYYAYLTSRGWTPDMIDAYAPLKSENPDCASWVIIPIYDSTGDNVLYYVGRDITGNEPNKYKNCNAPKSDIIFESDIEESVLFPKEAVICEGVFDSAKVPNAVAILGKTLASTQKNVIYDRLSHANTIYVALDAGAESEISNIASTVATWFPFKSVYMINTEAYGELDLGDMSKTCSSIQLRNFIKNNSTKYEKPDPVRSSLAAFRKKFKR